MDTLHSVLRSIRGETKSRRDHLDAFREFLDHRAARRQTVIAPTASPRVIAGLDPAIHEAMQRADAHHGPAGQARG